jgi:hypothetical protein
MKPDLKEIRKVIELFPKQPTPAKIIWNLLDYAEKLERVAEAAKWCLKDTVWTDYSRGHERLSEALKALED